MLAFQSLIMIALPSPRDKMNSIGPRTVKETRCKIIENNHESTTYLFVFMNTIFFFFFFLLSFSVTFKVMYFYRKYIELVYFCSDD